MAVKFGDTPERPRRFYKHAHAHGMEIHLDGKALRTPGRAPLILPTQAAAHMVAHEWESQVVHIDLANMPATRHAYTAIDRVSAARGEVVATLRASEATSMRRWTSRIVKRPSWAADQRRSARWCGSIRMCDSTWTATAM